MFNKHTPLLLGLLAMAMIVLGGLGALVGAAFGKMLIGAAIGAALPVAWCVLAFCFLKAVNVLLKGRMG